MAKKSTRSKGVNKNGLLMWLSILLLVIVIEAVYIMKTSHENLQAQEAIHPSVAGASTEAY